MQLNSCSTRYFTGHNKNDNEEEVFVYCACGVPETMTKKKSGVMSVELNIPNLEYPISGYVLEDTNVGRLIKSAEEKEMPILLRFEKQRNKDIDKTIPMAELTQSMEYAKGKITKCVVGVYHYNENKWILTTDARTNPEDDNEELKGIINRAKQGNVSEEDFFEDKIETNKAIQTFKSNFKFDKSQCLITMYNSICEISQKYELNLNNSTKQKMAINLTKLANMIQQRLDSNSNIDYSSYSHTRARYLIFSYEQHINNLKEENCKDFNNWCKQCLKHSIEIISWANEVEL